MSALWTSDEVAQALGAVIAAPFEANGVTFDSRAVGKGELFFALKGETTDGHGFVAEAMKRGARRFLKFGTGTVELLDESYNGNPMSVRAMLAILARTEPAKGGRRLLALGDMRELGEGADAYHAGLADAVSASGATQVFLCGPHMEALWRKLEPAQRGVHRPDSMALAGEVAAALRAGDVIAVKGSLGSKMKFVVDAILAASGGEAGR